MFARCLHRVLVLNHDVSHRVFACLLAAFWFRRSDTAPSFPRAWPEFLGYLRWHQQLLLPEIAFVSLCVYFAISVGLRFLVAEMALTSGVAKCGGRINVRRLG